MANKTIYQYAQRFFVLFLLIFGAGGVMQQAQAQQNKISVASFKRLETDITARVTAPKRDRSGELSALIRIVTPVKDFMFEPDAVGITAKENRTGEIWLYVPFGARRISIMHDELGIIRNYFYPDIIEKGTVYEMVLNTGGEEDVEVTEDNMQLLVLRPEPANANIYIDNDLMPTENGLFTATMVKGAHTYRIEAPMYEPQSGTINLGEEQHIMSVSLKPRFGYLEIFSLPEQDANVFVDSLQVGKTPYRSDRMNVSQYKIRIEKQNYFPIDTIVSIAAGETVRSTFTMESTIKPKVPINTFILLQAGYHPEQTTFGAMLGFGRQKGGYIGFRSDFGSASTDLEADEKGTLTNGEGTPFYKEGVTHKSRMSITAGYIHQLKKTIYLYAGAGYGNRTLAWETTEDVLVKSKDESATGVAAEFGGIARFGKFALSVGYHTVNFKHHEASVGIGVIF